MDLSAQHLPAQWNSFCADLWRPRVCPKTTRLLQILVELRLSPLVIWRCLSPIYVHSNNWNKWGLNPLELVSFHWPISTELMKKQSHQHQAGQGQCEWLGTHQLVNRKISSTGWWCNHWNPSAVVFLDNTPYFNRQIQVHKHGLFVITTEGLLLGLFIKRR